MDDFESLLAGATGEPSALTRWNDAQEMFAGRRFAHAAQALEELLAQAADSPGDELPLEGLGQVRLLLARAYYHSAQLDRAAQVARQVLAEHPDESYAHLLLGRTLQRAGRGDEAAPHLRLAQAMGLEV